QVSGLGASASEVWGSRLDDVRHRARQRYRLGRSVCAAPRGRRRSRAGPHPARTWAGPSIQSAVVADPVIRARGLHKAYGDLKAVRGIDLEVAGREIFAFLGPNGAGKTTTVEILEGYRGRSAGEVAVLGVDPADADRRWRQR